MPENLEYKARINRPEELEQLFLERGAKFSGVLNQTDTYFDVARGRLKLRETDGKSLELIYYNRDESSSGGMKSKYTIVHFATPRVKGLISRTYGVRAVVEKTRRLLMYRNARIHLDTVRRLGSFLEFEIVSEGNEMNDRDLLNSLKNVTRPFVVEELSVSYSDLVSAI